MAFTSTIHPLKDETAQARWRALWERSPQRSSFSSLPYVRAASEAFGLRCEMHLLADQDGDAAGALVFWRQRGPYREVVVPPFTQYAALVLRQPPAEAEVHARRSAFEALLAVLEARFAVLRFFIALTDVRPASWRGWRVTPVYTYLLPLLDEDDLPGRWSRATRRTFRKHGEAYRVEEHTADASAIVALCAESYGRHDRHLPADAARLLRLVDLLRAEGQVRLFTATSHEGDTPEGGLAVLHDGRTAHYWMAGSVPGPAMTVLLGHTLPRLRDDGIQQFDFVGANTPSIAEFKRHFGPVLTPYFYLEKITRPELRLLYRLKGA
ncbi:MAG: GNAT family N-acetyltransferase [Rhodothermales bacterium]